MPHIAPCRHALAAMLLLLISGGAHSNTLPGGTARPTALNGELEQALAAQGAEYRPRTEHLEADGSPRYTNRLIREESPYLLQHAHNPVDWYPWGAEAFAAAKRSNKPIFLSIGYSTCHWCHVMERESFENEAVATYLNQHFIAIKVDRERRPDVDEIYMTAVMLFSGHGGWPMSSFLTPGAEPFFGGTYYPRTAFLDLLERVHSAWRDQQPRLTRDAQRMTKRVRRSLSARQRAAELAPTSAGRARDTLIDRYDEIQGGFGNAPKFPHESKLLFLIDQVRRNPQATTSADALEAALGTLRHIDQGGIHDQIGGGFHRYSTTPDWLVPHFEEMLYNQALLGRAYLWGWQLSGDATLRRALEGVLDYVLRDMHSPEGGFYSATDADSPSAEHPEKSEEGLFFLWTREQIKAVLSPADAELAIDLFDVSASGNFEGSNILSLPESLRDYAAARQLNLSALMIRLDYIIEQLYAAREQRPHPQRDDKILAAWNGMLITTLAEAGRQLNRPDYIAAATRAVDFLVRQQRLDDGGLARVYYKGSAAVAAGLDDYAWLISGLLAVYDAERDQPSQQAAARHLQQAIALADQMLKRFGNPDSGALYMNQSSTDADQQALLVRPAQASDGAIPSGNSAALEALATLYRRSGKPHFDEAAKALIGAFAAEVNQQPHGYPYLLMAATTLSNGEHRDLGYAAAGQVRASAQLSASADGMQQLNINIDIADGWHINSNAPLDDDLIATRLSIHQAPGANPGIRLSNIRWPAAHRRQLGFRSDSLALFEGKVQIGVSLADTTGGSNGVPDADIKAIAPTIALQLQACSDKVCLAPETLYLHPARAPDSP